MGNFSWTNFKPFVIIYLVCCILGYSLSPGHAYDIDAKKTDIEMIYEMWTDAELIQLKKEIDAFDKARTREMLTKNHPEYLIWNEKDWERYEMQQVWENSVWKYFYELPSLDRD